MRHAPSAIDALDQALARIADPATQGNIVFTDIFADSARLEAAAADERRRAGQSLGPLDGKIISVKALYDVAGHVTAAGSAVLRDQPAATADAAVVERLRRAGAVLIGRTVMTEFAFSAVGINPYDGTPGNPRDRTRIAGGSSTGAAISVAAGIVDIAIGSDTGGSIRIPAALCGVVGFKPTSGLISTVGAFPLSPTLDVAGPLAASVADCAITFAELAGMEPIDLSDAATEGVSLTIVHGKIANTLTPAVAEHFATAIERLSARQILSRAGTIESELDLLRDLDAIGTFPSFELAATLKRLGFSSLEGIDPRTAARIVAGQSLAEADYLRMHGMRREMIAVMDARLSGGEILVLPTLPITAPTIDSVEAAPDFHRVNGSLLAFTRVANLFDLPAISLPLPGANLPVGLMLMAARGQDRRLLQAAAKIEAVLTL